MSGGEQWFWILAVSLGGVMLVDCVHPADTWGCKAWRGQRVYGEGTRKTRKMEEEDRETTDLSAMAK